MVAARYKYRLCSSWSPCTVELRLLSSYRGLVRLAYQLKFFLSFRSTLPISSGLRALFHHSFIAIFLLMKLWPCLWFISLFFAGLWKEFRDFSSLYSSGTVRFVCFDVWIRCLVLLVCFSSSEMWILPDLTVLLNISLGTSEWNFDTVLCSLRF